MCSQSSTARIYLLEMVHVINITLIVRIGLTSVGSIGEVQEKVHHFVCVLPAAVGEEESLGSGLLEIVQNLWQPLVLLDVLGEVLAGL